MVRRDRVPAEVDVGELEEAHAPSVRGAAATHAPSRAITASVYSSVEAVPPTSRVIVLPLAQRPLDRGADPVGARLLPGVVEHLAGGEHHRGRVRDALPDDVGRGAVHRLEDPRS